MIKTEPRIKQNITEQDQINAMEYIAGSYFTTDENGEIQYTPYYSSEAQILAIVRYFIEGIQFEENEDIYESVKSDNDIASILNAFYITDKKQSGNPTKSQKVFGKVMTVVEDIIEYRKKENLAKIQNESTSLLTYRLLEIMEKENDKLQKEIETTSKLEEWLDAQTEINNMIPEDKREEFYKDFDINSLMDMAVNKMSESELHRKNKEIVELSRENKAKENKIIELQNEYARQCQKENVKNVISDKE